MSVCSDVNFKSLGCLPFTKSFLKFRLESKWNTTFRVVRVENSPGITERLKRESCFSGRNVPTEIHVPFRQTSSLIPVPDSLCKWEGFVRMVNSSPERNITIRNLTYQLPEPWTKRFSHVNGKQPSSLWDFPILYIVRRINAFVKRLGKCYLSCW